MFGQKVFMSPQESEPKVDLSLPIVQELIDEYGNENVSYKTQAGETEVSTVSAAFTKCGDLSDLGRASPFALRLAIEDSIRSFDADK